jgi:hypothetical protein
LWRVGVYLGGRFTAGPAAGLPGPTGRGLNMFVFPPLFFDSITNYVSRGEGVLVYKPIFAIRRVYAIYFSFITVLLKHPDGGADNYKK